MFLEIIEKIADEIIKNEEYLTELDREIGDGDHGVNMARGFTEIKNQLVNFKDLPVSDVFTKMGMILLTKVGGASGAIYGTAFMSAGTFLKGKMEFNNQILLGTLNSMIEGIQKRGKAVQGEKTMLDTIMPTYSFLEKSFSDGKSLKDIKNETIEAAKKSMEATENIVATKGRASYLGERSIGHIDPGAVSSYLMIKVACENI
ncbi:dihydroxyacetone kinase subunit DhaL [Fusobacterium russii]|uniref:dihydroxyacetone kinase subunit DhaL n=1 Tax=Fusobacterium russii TaxID=854 RepID=UPI000399C86C|nr:dihydroxyacetone kinase subunit DhaL [Fusobacterium russii]